MNRAVNRANGALFCGRKSQYRNDIVNWHNDEWVYIELRMKDEVVHLKIKLHGS